jgi:hypothetical protein
MNITPDQNTGIGIWTEEMFSGLPGRASPHSAEALLRFDGRARRIRRRYDHPIPHAGRRTKTGVPRRHHRTRSETSVGGNESQGQNGGHDIFGGRGTGRRNGTGDDHNRTACAEWGARRDRAFPHHEDAPAALRRGIAVGSSTAAARRWQVGHRFISEMELGRENPALATIVLLAHGLGCELADLFPPSRGVQSQ